jgi:hypothetical protein
MIGCWVAKISSSRLRGMIRRWRVAVQLSRRIQPIRHPSATGLGSVPGALGPAGVGPEQRGQDADGRGLAGAVGPRDAEHGGRRHLPIDAPQGLGGTEALGEAFGGDGEHGGHVATRV